MEGLSIVDAQDQFSHHVYPLICCSLSWSFSSTSGKSSFSVVNNISDSSSGWLLHLKFVLCVAQKRYKKRNYFTSIWFVLLDGCNQDETDRFCCWQLRWHGGGIAYLSGSAYALSLCRYYFMWWRSIMIILIKPQMSLQKILLILNNIAFQVVMGYASGFILI